MDIPWAKPNFWGNEIEYANKALKSSWISSGEFVDKLEKKFSETLNKKYTVTTSNGTTAIHLAYLSLGLKPGDEIILPGFAFQSAANIALNMHLVPVFTEVDNKTWCLSAKDIEKKITRKTKAIIPIHTYGNVCDMDEIMDLANSKNIAVIEDCAESLFSKYKNKYCGTYGHINTFSFQATKTITTGEGGLVVTDDEKLFNKMILYRSHGLIERGKYWHELPGYNFRLTNIQAAIGLAQFENKNRIISERKRVHQKYIGYLKNVQGITLQHFKNNVAPVLWAFALRIDDNAFPQGRDKVIEQLKNVNIETRPGFVASSLLKIYEKHKLPVCEKISNTVISLPTYPTLSDKEIEYICNQLIKLKK